MTALRKYRMAYDYSQHSFAAKVHISNTYLCELETGKHKPSPALARVIADAFGCKVEAVFPDGVAQKVCRKWHAEPVAITPPEPPRPPAFYTYCPTCGAQGIFEPCYQCRRSLEAGA